MVSLSERICMEDPELATLLKKELYQTHEELSVHSNRSDSTCKFTWFKIVDLTAMEFGSKSNSRKTLNVEKHATYLHIRT